MAPPLGSHLGFDLRISGVCKAFHRRLVFAKRGGARRVGSIHFGEGGSYSRVQTRTVSTMQSRLLPLPRLSHTRRCALFPGRPARAVLAQLLMPVVLYKKARQIHSLPLIRSVRGAHLPVQRQERQQTATRHVIGLRWSQLCDTALCLSAPLPPSPFSRLDVRSLTRRTCARPPPSSSRPLSLRPRASQHFRWWSVLHPRQRRRSRGSH